VQHVAQPDPEPHDDRVVEAQLGVDGGDGLGAHATRPEHGQRRVARQQAGQQEREEGDGQQCQDEAAEFADQNQRMPSLGTDSSAPGGMGAEEMRWTMLADEVAHVAVRVLPIGRVYFE